MIVYDLKSEDFEYAYRVDGPYDEQKGLLFDKTKVLLDPYAQAVAGQEVWGHKRTRTYHARVVRDSFDWGVQPQSSREMSDLIIYELHVRGFTQHPSSGVKHPGTFAGLKEKIPYLKELGVTDPELPYALTESDLPAIAEEYEKLSKILIERKKNGTSFNFFHFMIDLDQGPCAIKRLRGCSCGNEYVAVTPEGDIYPCHQFVGMDEWKMGSVLDDSIDHKMKKMFSKANIYSKEECADCWAKFYCSGGCNANNMQYNNTIFKPHKLSCALEQKRLECAIMIKAALADE